MRVYHEGQVYCCGGEQVFLLDVDRARHDGTERIWTWRAGDSPRIAPEHRAWFSIMDECKPVRGGEAVLVCSSSGGGVALIRRSDDACLFYAHGRNAHSAALIGDGAPSRDVLRRGAPDVLAAAFSIECDQLRLYSLHPEPLNAEPAWSIPLPAAHGVVWDAQRDVLWALGGTELLKLRVRSGAAPEGEVLRRWELPAPGGHDLFPLDERNLAITMSQSAARFDAVDESFNPLTELPDGANVKSISRNASTGGILYTRGEPITTDKLCFVGGEDLILPEDDLYKARWNSPNPMSEPS